MGDEQRLGFIERRRVRGRHGETALQKGETPEILVFLSSCLAGYNRTLANEFLLLGTDFVIGFRAKYQSNQALPFTEIFYAAWAERGLEVTEIQKAFELAARVHPHAEPVLYGQDFSYRFWSKTKRAELQDVGSKIFRKGDTEFFTPHWQK